MEPFKIGWTLCDPRNVGEIAKALEKLVSRRGSDFEIVREDGSVVMRAATALLAAEAYVGLANISTHLKLGDEVIAEVTGSRDIRVRLPEDVVVR